jgi:hypothetical protein
MIVIDAGKNDPTPCYAPSSNPSHEYGNQGERGKKKMKGKQVPHITPVIPSVLS